MTFYVNLLGAKTSVICVDTKGMGHMKYVCRILTAKFAGRRILWRNKCRQCEWQCVEDVNWIPLAQGEIQWQALLNTVVFSVYSRVPIICMLILQKSLILCWLDKMLHKWFTAVHCKGKDMTGPMITEEEESFYDEMKITGKCTFYKGWL